ncbi:MAG: glycosyltransferase family protein [Candidatus Vogelbacteria bacterium]|nr:glycosyltransferase family protein [Candidatus Vogelbacteria bacterium]
MSLEKRKAGAIIQARMGSSRLPGKVMMPILGKPLIGHMIDRLRQAKLVDPIIVATSIDEANNILCDYLDNIGVTVFRGSENDVLARFYEAAKKYNLKYIVRLTADCPLIDPNIVDQYVSKFFMSGADHLCGTSLLAEGLDTEVFSFNALKDAFLQAKKRSEREHVTQYFHNNSEIFKLVKIENKTDDSNYRITVDEPADFEVVKNIFAALYVDQNHFFDITAIKQFLDKHPEIRSLNSSIVRNEGLLKSLSDDFEGG